VPFGIAYIQARQHTIVTITDQMGNHPELEELGLAGFRGSRKARPSRPQQAASKLPGHGARSRRARGGKCGSRVRVGRESAIRALAARASM